MQVAMEFLPPVLGQEPAALEVYPHATFAALLRAESRDLWVVVVYGIAIGVLLLAVVGWLVLIAAWVALVELTVAEPCHESATG